MTIEERSAFFSDEETKETLAALRGFIIRVAGENSTPEEVRALPEVAKVYLGYSLDVPFSSFPSFTV